MDYLPYFLKHYDLNLQPSNSELIDVELAQYILYPGAHIATSNPYEHFHHGIVLDPDAPDISIIHLWGPDKHHGSVLITTLPIFLAGSIEDLGKRTRQLYLINYENDTLEKQQNTVKIAKEMLEKSDEISYDLVTTNCEGFANFCRTGKWESQQIQKLKDLFIIKASEIYEKVKDADAKNGKDITSLINSIPINALTPSERALYDQLC
jgi:hypothetical protein